MMRIFFWRLSLSAIVLTIAFGTLLAQETTKPAVDVGVFIKELLMTKVDATQGQLALWLPYEFFVESASTMPGAKRGDIEKQFAAIKAYNVIIVECRSTGADGKFVQGEAGARARAVLKLADGRTLSPITPMPEQIAVPVGEFKQEMAQTLGEDADNFHVLIFPGALPDGKPVVDVAKRGTLSLVLKADKSFSEANFSWRTPFDALTGPHTCARCHETVSGKWFFCPWCGTKIE
ncbi:MAG TPA: hypothetical protein VGL77_14230 [Armatimonadota bacterium]|jgi:hypothetical protein